MNEVAKDVDELDAMTSKYVKIFLENAPNAMRIVKETVAFVSNHPHSENLEHVKGAC